MTGDGLCECGCGQPVRRYARFRNGHHRRKAARAYVEEDRGFETPCWVWQLSIGRGGYGKMRVIDDHRGAHVVYWEGANGPVPDGLVLHHRCRVRACVRPDHLEPVTAARNARARPTTRLTPEAVEVIRAGGSAKALARQFGVSVSNIYYVRRGDTWRDV